ncbi:DUF551 domain-containing protein [Stenotrophomonas maltophilia]|uniref:DUF551 domain-containing protein n=1 Tax=Stenotrophomonas maltophilia TaxID=40324 RepID=UPI001FA78580|nr:DUF551 domain-containing protein [Stenotrophomonas maltophilia]
MDAIEKRARELLAAEYERDGREGMAESVRRGVNMLGLDDVAIRAIIAALTPQWQPISGAPMDRTRLLGWRNEEFPFVMMHDGRDWVVDLGDTELIMEPTHWMPLPFAPGNQP